MKNRPFFIYLIHHNQPDLLSAQVAYFRKTFPEAEIIVGLTCNLHKPVHRPKEMFSIARENNLQIIESDTGRSFSNQSVQTICSNWFFRKLILRIPLLRKSFGQDPSSGHARLLNKMTKHSMSLPLDSEVWFVEGDILPIKKPKRLPDGLDLLAPVYEFNFTDNSYPYLNPRVMQYRTSDALIRLHKKGFLDWAPYMGCKFWFDTGSRTFKMLTQEDLRKSIQFEEMRKAVAGSWDRNSDEFKNLQSKSVRDLIELDSRVGRDGQFKFDLYDGAWLHIGKTSGYFDGQRATLTDHLISQTLSAIDLI
jgi:hypothetical protein